MSRRRTTTLAVVSAAALALGTAATAAAPAGAAPTAASPAAPGGTLHVDDPGGSARSLVTTAGHPMARPAGLAASATPTDVAQAVVRTNAARLGVSGATFAAKNVQHSLAGGDVVRLQQTVAGVPVLGGEAVVDLDLAGNTRSVHSETLTSAAPGTTPAIAAALATQRALSSVAIATHHATTDLLASAPTRAIYDPRIFGAPGLQRASLVWSVTVRGKRDLGVDHLVLVDALHGVITLDLDQLGTAAQITVCDAVNQPAQVPCTAPVDVASSVVQDVHLASDYATATYNFYQSNFGRDSVDNAGLPLKSTVRYCPDLLPVDCPFQNAFWDGTQMVYGDGFASADDVVGHELTHGVTQYTSGLFYFFQSGAINESISDIFGEYIDQVDGLGTDGAAVDWKLGEDLPPAFGVIRDMKTPHTFNQPDRMGDPLWETHPVLDQFFDNGGVHTNSGVGNKLGYLLGNSEALPVTFNGHTVAGLGIPKAAKIIYGATQLLTSGSDYRAFATALRSSCSNLQTVVASGVTASDCAQVEEAILATEMDQQPAAVGVTDAGVCPAGTVSTTTFADNLDGHAPNNWATDGTSMSWSLLAQGSGPLWFYGSDNANPYGNPQVYSTTGHDVVQDNLWGDDPDILSQFGTVFDGPLPATYDGRLMTRPLKVPAGASYFRFEHAFGFETGGTASTNHDGGRVEYTTNGTTWVDAGPLMAGAGDNGYGFNVAGGVANSHLASDNPLPNAAAFTRHSQGYTATRVNVTSLAGKTVQFRFRITTNQAFGDYGWFIDDVKLYSCGAVLSLSVPPTIVLGPTSVTVAANDLSAHVTTTYRTRSAKPGVALPAFGPVRTATSRVIPVPFPGGGGTTCISVTSTTNPGTTPALSSSAVRCMTLPVDDRGLKRAGAWSSVRSTGSYLATLSSSTRKGSTLTLPAARGTHLIIVAAKLRTGGVVGVYVRGKRVALVNLAAPSTRLKQLIDLKLAGLAGVPVVLKVESTGKTVQIDGLAVRP